MRTLKSKQVSLFLGIVTLLGAWTPRSRAQGEAPATGELKLEGKYIRKLVLHSKDGKIEKFDNPGESVRLPVGMYRLREIHLEGGYASSFSMVAGAWKTVDKDKPAVLEVGAPLRQTVKASRQGPVLVLDYELLGVGLNHYVPADMTKPPQFTIHKGDKEIASGKFKFG